jgi:ubiquinone/menaquinone biosynthesis C-methylase UbiE
MDLDGFDSGAGRLSVDSFREVARGAARELSLGRGARVIEVGCGAGAFLSCLRESGAALMGMDYAPSLLAHARAALPDVPLTCADAADLPAPSGIADAIVVHSVFQYFPDLAYARRAVDEFRRVASSVLILDVPNLATRAEAELARAQAGSKPADHQYYPAEFFDRRRRVWSSDVPDYGNARYRFNVLL